MDEEDYDIVPHREVTDLKKQIKELRSKKDKSYSHELLNSMDALATSMDSMLKLFKEAAEDLKVEEKEHSKIEENIDEVIEQNKTIAEGIVAIHDTIKDFIAKHHTTQMQVQPAPLPKPNFPPPQPNFQQPPKFEAQPRERPPQAGPVAMPAMPFPNLEEKPRKKGLFGRLKK